MYRRELLAGLTGTVMVALAGCVGEGGRSDDDTGDDDPPRLVKDESFPPVDEPAAVPPEPLCGVCNMTPADYPHSNAQAVHEDESRQFFCTPGCLATYIVVTDQFAETDASLATAWARDAGHESLVEFGDLYLVLDTDEDRGIDPMRNPLPYEAYADALSWVEAYDDLSEDDIVTADELTVSDVEAYRAFYIA